MTINVLITGATDGIGLALARAYAARGARLILVVRVEAAHGTIAYVSSAASTLPTPDYSARSYLN